jgi:hypothetical protein
VMLHQNRGLVGTLTIGPPDGRRCATDCRKKD